MCPPPPLWFLDMFKQAGAKRVKSPMGLRSSFHFHVDHPFFCLIPGQVLVKAVAPAGLHEEGTVFYYATSSRQSFQVTSCLNFFSRDPEIL